MLAPRITTAMRNMSVSPKVYSRVVAYIAWGLLSLLTVFIFWGMLDRARLIRDNENEQLLNSLFSSIRQFDNFGSAIESNQILSERISAVAVYGSASPENEEDPVETQEDQSDTRVPLISGYAWGQAPQVFDEQTISKQPQNRGRFTLLNWSHRSVVFIISIDRTVGERGARERSSEERSTLRTVERYTQEREPLETDGTPVPGIRTLFREDQSSGQRVSVTVNRNIESSNSPARNSTTNRIQMGFPFFNILEGGKYLYIEAVHSAYWRTVISAAILFPLIIVGLLLLVLYIRRLYLHNIEYRERIEAQKNLVVLGTAASTLAHEIKNPLLSIRLQTSIIEKLFPQKAQDEIGIINLEVERMSSLIYRISDYLRNPKGDPEPCDCLELLRDTWRRLCNRELSLAPVSENRENPSPYAGDVRDDNSRAIPVQADTERLRSVFENLIRNALESGSSLDEIGASIHSAGGMVFIEIYDRGNGIAQEDLDRIFDPFFTRKSAGTGIGLSISQRFVEAAGGTLRLENRKDGGVCATVELPALTRQVLHQP